MAERGRPPKGVERSNILLRMPTDLIEQVDIFKESLEAERGGFVINRTDMLIRLIEVGLQTLTQARQPAAQPAPASHVNGQGVSAPEPAAQPAIPLALEPAPKTAQPVAVPQASETPEPAVQTPRAKTPAKHALPREVLERIADERTHCEGLSLREFAQRLFDKDIYQAKAKDGSRVPANPGNVKKWLEQAREAGLL
jgi:hypothetical protein